MSQRAKVTLLVVCVVLALGAAAASFFYHSSGKTGKVDMLMALPATFTTASRYGDTSVIFSNGRALVSYDYLSGASSVVTPVDMLNGLAGIDTLSASDDGRYVIFHQEKAITGSTLAATLQRKQLPLNSDYWWVYDATQQTFTPLPAGTLLAKFNGSQLTLLTAGESGEALITYSLPAVTATKNINIPGSTNFWPYSNGYLLQLAKGNLAYTEDGVVAQTYFSNTTLLGIVAGSDKALGMTTTEDNDQQVVVLDLTAHTSRVLAAGLAEQAVFDAKGYGLYVTSNQTTDGYDNTFYLYDFAKNSTTSWTLTGDAESKQSATDVQINVLLGDRGVIGDFDSGKPYLLGTGLAAIKMPFGYTRSVTIQGTAHSISFDNNDRGLYVSGPEPSATATVMTAVTAQLKTDGANADLFSLTYEPADGD